MKLLVQRLMARDFAPNVAEFHVRIAVLTGYTASGIPGTEAVGHVCPGGTCGHQPLPATEPVGPLQEVAVPAA